LLSSDDGCTATALLVEAMEGGSVVVQVANVGDSEALLVDMASTQWSRLTEDHRIANNLGEQARLAEASGEALKNHRLYGLNISRMLGDRFLKEQNLGFSASPHVSQPIVVGPEEEVMVVLASDGLWDVLTPARAAMMVARAEGGAAGVADVLVNHAVAQKSKDDISVMVLHITPMAAAAEGSG